ncbi:MAG: hypothetical protein ACFB0B_00355 [Thermonemataceae bacterium]
MNRASGELGVAKNEPKTEQWELGAAKSRNRACELDEVNRRRSSAKLNPKLLPTKPTHLPAGFSGQYTCFRPKNKGLGKIKVYA